MKRSTLFAATLSIAVVTLAGPASAQVQLWDTGAPHTVIFNGAETYLGYSSGNISGTAPQRWAAIPFRIDDAGVTITRIDADWFIVAGNEAATVEYIIWRRLRGLDRPVDGEQFATGTLGPYGPGIDDPRVAGTEDWLHQYDVKIPIPAGDYFLTIYAAGIGQGNTTGFSNAAWLTGGDLQDEALEQAFMWRSATFPAPGFEMYAPASILPVGAQDPDDRWNPSFSLYGGQILTADTATVDRGVLQSGNVDSLDEDDEDKLIISQRPPFLATDPNCRLNATYTAPGAASSLRIIMVSSSNGSPPANVPQNVEVFDNVANAFLEVDRRPVTGADTEVRIALPGDPNRFISGTNQIRVRTGTFDRGVLFLNWVKRYDRLVIEFGGV